MALQINGAGAMEPVLLLTLADGRLLVRADDLAPWGVRAPVAGVVMREGETYYALDAIPGLSYRIDEAQQQLHVEAPAEAFNPTRLTGQMTRFSAPPPAPRGAFLNYDLSLQRQRGDSQRGALVEFGVFNRRGTSTASFLARDHGLGDRLVRLDTVWIQDHPERMTSLRIGDMISAAGDWGRSVRLGGVQWTTDFGTQPGFVPFPLPSFDGGTALPSTLELIVDDARRMARDLPAGPFSVVDLPVVDGAGTATLIVRDLLGREQRVSLPYYVSPRLLQAGLHAYSYEVGLVRSNYALHSNDYRSLTMVATHRYGFSDRLTGEAHAEIQHAQQSAGISATWLAPSLGVFNASAAASRNREDLTGALFALGYERRSGSFSIGGSLQRMSSNFAQLGVPLSAAAPREQGQVYVSLASERHGSFALSLARQHTRSDEALDVATASYNVALARSAWLGASLVHVAGDAAATAVNLVLTVPLSRDTSASVSVSRRAGLQQSRVDVQRNTPAGTGYGYRAYATAGGSSRFGAEVTAQSDIGTAALQLGLVDQHGSVRFSLSGGMVRLGGDTFLSRRLDQSFGVVQVPGYPGVQVYADNQPVAVTDADGNALVPGLRAYEQNPIRIEQGDLPLDAEIDAVQVLAVPYRRSGVLLRFPVRRSRGALLAVVLDDGEPLPAGATAHIVGESSEFPSGMRGEIYVTGLSSSNRVQVRWRGKQCEFAVLFPATSEPMPSLGPYLCRGVAR